MPARGIVDSGAEISIMDKELFKTVADVARLRKRELKKADKVPRTFDQKPFLLDGRLDLDITFGGKTMRTPIYLKMDSREQLLLSEGVCRQLGIISYHPDVTSRRNRSPSQKRSPAKPDQEAVVPTIRVQLVQSVRLPPRQSTFVQVRVDTDGPHDSILVEHDTEIEDATGLQVEDALLCPTDEGLAHLLVTNPSGFTQTADCGTLLGKAVEASVVSPPNECGVNAQAFTVTAKEVGGPVPRDIGTHSEPTNAESARMKKLLDLLGDPELEEPEKTRLQEFLVSNHQAF